jgi:hypothetical protein
MFTHKAICSPRLVSIGLLVPSIFPASFENIFLDTTLRIIVYIYSGFTNGVSANCDLSYIYWINIFPLHVIVRPYVIHRLATLNPLIMNIEEKKLFLHYRDLHQQFYTAIKQRKSQSFIRGIYVDLKKSWEAYTAVKIR